MGSVGGVLLRSQFSQLLRFPLRLLGAILPFLVFFALFLVTGLLSSDLFAAYATEVLPASMLISFSASGTVSPAQVITDMRKSQQLSLLQGTPVGVRSLLLAVLSPFFALIFIESALWCALLLSFDAMRFSAALPFLVVALLVGACCLALGGFAARRSAAPEVLVPLLTLLPFAMFGVWQVPKLFPDAFAVQVIARAIPSNWLFDAPSLLLRSPSVASQAPTLLLYCCLLLASVVGLFSATLRQFSWAPSRAHRALTTRAGVRADRALSTNRSMRWGGYATLTVLFEMHWKNFIRNKKLLFVVFTYPVAPMFGGAITTLLSTGASGFVPGDHLGGGPLGTAFWVHSFSAAMTMLILAVASSQYTFWLVEQKESGFLFYLRSTPLRFSSLYGSFLPIILGLSIIGACIYVPLIGVYVEFPNAVHMLQFLVGMTLAVLLAASLFFLVGSLIRSRQIVEYVVVLVLLCGYFGSGMVFPFGDASKWVTAVNPWAWIYYSFDIPLVGAGAGHFPVWVYWLLEAFASVVLFQIAQRVFSWGSPYARSTGVKKNASDTRSRFA